MSLAVDKDARNTATAIHLVGLLNLVLPPVGGLIASYLVWLAKKDTSSFVDHHGREVMNLQITSALLQALSVLLFVFTLRMGWLGFAVVLVANGVLLMWGAWRASEGLDVHFPFAFPFLTRRDPATGLGPIG
jgi:uncharacterized Tic20 family protein